MGKTLIINRLFAYSEKNNKGFNEDFCEGLNIIRGKNTSGKSTIFQSILYTFGINDVKAQLSEILDEDVIFRVDCQLHSKNTIDKLILIRDKDSLYLKLNQSPTKIFLGISGDNSTEHINLKQYINEIFDFKLHLESGGNVSLSPIEVSFLPYYISQTLGWIYLRKSFSSLDFYKNFKNDYLDYFLGIQDDSDRVEKLNLEKELQNVSNEINFLVKMEKQNEDIIISKIVDEEFIEESIKFVKDYSETRKELQVLENSYIKKCNELTHSQQRKNILLRVLRNQKTQNPEGGNCPTCDQPIPLSIEHYYKHKQEINDTEKEIAECKEKIKDIKSEINQVNKKIEKLKDVVEKEKSILSKSAKQNITFHSWLNNKSQLKLDENVQQKIGSLTIQQNAINGKLKAISANDIESLRRTKDKAFKKIFVKYLEELGVKIPSDNRFLELYRISAFPSQGVELHKTILSYHFAFNFLLKENNNIHRFPFLLDSIFNEDIEIENKKKIIDFIQKNKPADTQTFLSISEAKLEKDEMDNYIEQEFKGIKKTITIGQSVYERAFLAPIKDSDKDLINETISLMEITN